MGYKVDKEVAQVHEILLGAKFEESRAARKIGKKNEIITAKRLYELVKEHKAKKHKLYFTNLGINNVRESIDIIGLVENMLRVDKCDDNIPIVLDHRGFILDGIHRTIKSILKGRKFIWCYKIRVPEEERITE